MPKSNVSQAVISRLPRYYRFLTDLKNAGFMRISSRELSEKMGLTASQIRQDLNCFGGFGQQGYGYNVDVLQSEIREIIGISTEKSAILIGVGNLGRAICTHIDFRRFGLRLIGIFDKNPALSGQVVNGLPVHSSAKMEDFCRAHSPTVAILCLPAFAAGETAEKLSALGLLGVWNFSHCEIPKELGLVCENVHLEDSCMRLSYKLSKL